MKWFTYLKYALLFLFVSAIGGGAMFLYLNVQNDKLSFTTEEPTPTITLSIDTPSPTPTLFECNANGKIIYTTTQEDCTSLQQPANNKKPPPCSLIPRGLPVPCVPGF